MNLRDDTMYKIILNNLYSDYDKGHSLSTFIYFNEFKTDEELVTKKNCFKSNLIKHNKSEEILNNNDKMIRVSNFNITPLPVSTSPKTTKSEKRDHHSTLKSISIPLQHYSYEDVASSNNFTEKNISNFKNSFSTNNFNNVKGHINTSSGDFLKKENLKSGRKTGKSIDDNQINLNKIRIISIKKNNYRNKIQKAKGEITLLLPNFNTKIHKELYINEKEILISKKIVQRLSDDSILYDGEVSKINKSKNGYKKVIRYFQITKTQFKYYNSIFSSSVWNDKPLFRSSLNSLENIKISNDEVIKLKFNDLKFVFNLTIKKIDKTNGKETDKNLFLEFGCEDPEIGLSLIKIIMLLKKI